MTHTPSSVAFSTVSSPSSNSILIRPPSTPLTSPGYHLSSSNLALTLMPTRGLSQDRFARSSSVGGSQGTLPRSFLSLFSCLSLAASASAASLSFLSTTSSASMFWRRALVSHFFFSSLSSSSYSSDRSLAAICEVYEYLPPLALRGLGWFLSSWMRFSCLRCSLSCAILSLRSSGAAAGCCPAPGWAGSAPTPKAAPRALSAASFFILSSSSFACLFCSSLSAFWSAALSLAISFLFLAMNSGFLACVYRSFPDTDLKPCLTALGWAGRRDGSTWPRASSLAWWTRLPSCQESSWPTTQRPSFSNLYWPTSRVSCLENFFGLRMKPLFPVPYMTLSIIFCWYDSFLHSAMTSSQFLMTW
mmetsp:Transcript_28968/g.57905  ORF Transcript_28968/g.57905 Transcript_28968/m.57905 type:complete len:360 (-) Transcript_28968:731-1810(-)